MEKMNLPNRLTIIRILLVPLIVFVLLAELILNKFLIAGMIFIVASITDHIDGRIARKFNQVTDFGKFADPLADKILVISSLICFIQLGLISAVPVIILIFREFLVTAIRLAAAKEGDVIAASKWGKAKTVSQIISILLILFISHLGKKNLFTWCEVSVWISAVFSIVSGVIYFKDNIKIIKGKL